ncbi:hypothetical protein AAC387_Pa03g2555 [Persea americana]
MQNRNTITRNGLIFGDLKWPTDMEETGDVEGDGVIQIGDGAAVQVRGGSEMASVALAVFTIGDGVGESA